MFSDKIESIKDYLLYANECKEYLQFKATQQAPSSAIIAHTSNSTVFLSQSAFVTWILDSGASYHLAGNPSLFSKLSFPKTSHNITLVDGSKPRVAGIGQGVLSNLWFG